MKAVYLIIILACILTGSIVLSQPQRSDNRLFGNILIDANSVSDFLRGYCSGGTINGYHIVTGKTLEILENKVMKGIDDTNKWSPYSGVTYDPNNKWYLQIMVNSNDNFKYPD